MPAMPSMPSVSLPSMPDLSMPGLLGCDGQTDDGVQCLRAASRRYSADPEQMGYEVTTFKVTWGLLPKARLRLKSHGHADIQKVNAMQPKRRAAACWSQPFITSAATAKRIQSTMKLGTAWTCRPASVNMKFVSLKANEKEELPRDTDDLEISCK